LLRCVICFAPQNLSSVREVKFFGAYFSNFHSKEFQRFLQNRSLVLIPVFSLSLSFFLFLALSFSIQQFFCLSLSTFFLLLRKKICFVVLVSVLLVSKTYQSFFACGLFKRVRLLILCLSSLRTGPATIYPSLILSSSLAKRTSKYFKKIIVIH